MIHVVAAIIQDASGRYLIAKRAKEKHQGGLWEFAGGKVEQGEDAISALKREIDEELGVVISTAEPFIQVRHQYSDKHILLDIWRASSYEGEAYGREGQEIAWLTVDELRTKKFPEANESILKAILLPDMLAISPGLGVQAPSIKESLKRLDERAITYLVYRDHQLDDRQYLSNLTEMLSYKSQFPKLRIIANRSASVLNALDSGLNVDGIHLTKNLLHEQSQRPFASGLVSASCHCLEDLLHAQKIAVDFVFLSPIKATATHPDAPALGWDEAKILIEQVNIPVYLLGGMRQSDLPEAKLIGARGVAGIRDFLPTRM